MKLLLKGKDYQGELDITNPLLIEIYQANPEVFIERLRTYISEALSDSLFPSFLQETIARDRTERMKIKSAIFKDYILSVKPKGKLH
jgi:hypothetical protein